MARIKRNLKPRKESDPAVVSKVADEAVEQKADDLDDLLVPPVTAVVDEEGEEELHDPPANKPKLLPGQEPAVKPIGPVVIGKKRQVSLSQPRKLTKKQSASLAEWRGKNHGKQVDVMVTSHIQAARKKFGHTGVYHGEDTKDLVIGFPVPALSFEFLIANDIFPLSLIIQLVGEHGTYKSGLLAELARWFDLAGGIAVVNENETKFNPQWYESIMGSEAYSRMQLNRCDSVESWQQHLTFDLEGHKKLMDGTNDNPGPGRTFPILYGVDSVMGKLSDKSQINVHKEGSAGRGFPVEALIISRYLRTLPQWLDRWPFTVVLVNHLKLVKNEDTGQDERSKAGGVLINFQESFELEMRRVGPKKIECQEYEGSQVEISCAKNSFGPTHRTIRTRVLWWEEPDPLTGDFTQRTVWDWDWSTVHLLFSIINGGDKNVRLRKHLKDAGFHMEFGSPTALNATAFSKTLGVTSKDPLLWHEMGALIRENKEVTSMLRTALRINRRPLLQGDYLSQMGELAEEMP